MSYNGLRGRREMKIGFRVRGAKKGGWSRGGISLRVTIFATRDWALSSTDSQLIELGPLSPANLRPLIGQSSAIFFPNFAEVRNWIWFQFLAGYISMYFYQDVSHDLWTSLQVLVVRSLTTNEEGLLLALPFPDFFVAWIFSWVTNVCLSSTLSGTFAV